MWWSISWVVLVGCSPDLSGSMGQLCSVTSRTPLVEATTWTGPEEQDVLDTLTAQGPVLVDWEGQTLDEPSAPLSVVVGWNTENLVVIEQDCPYDPVFLSIPVDLDLDLGEGGVTGVLQGELKVVPEGEISVVAEGEVEPSEPWASAAEDYVQRQQIKGELRYWRATVRGAWSEAGVRLVAVNIDDDGEDWVTGLWDGTWVTEETQP